MTELCWVAWRNSVANFGQWHRTYDPEHQHVICGKIAAGLVSTRTSPPPKHEECKTCVVRDNRRVRKLVYGL